MSKKRRESAAHLFEEFEKPRNFRVLASRKKKILKEKGYNNKRLASGARHETMVLNT